MKSKIISVLASLAYLLAVSCVNNAIPESAVEITAPKMTVSESSFTFDEEGGIKEFVVIANSAWEASCDVSWIELSPTSGDADSTIVKVSVSALNDPEPRTGTITVICDTVVRAVEVKQSAVETGSKLTFEFYGTHLTNFPVIYGGKSLEAEIDWGDENKEKYALNIEHIYDVFGYYTVTVRMTDNTGLYFSQLNGYQLIDLSKF